MRKIYLTVKRKYGENDEELGKIISLGFHIIDQPRVSQGVVRLTSIRDDKFRRLKNDQLVITADGLGYIKDYKEKKDSDNNIIVPEGVNVKVRKQKETFYNLGHIQVIDIMDAFAGTRHPSLETQYPLLLIDDAPVEFVLDKRGRANLSLNSQIKYKPVRLFARESSGIKILGRLIENKLWNPVNKNGKK
jgi:hypothetical protein